MDLGFRSFHRSGSIIYVKRIFSDCPGFSVGFGFFLVFQILDAWFLRFVVSVVFRGLDSVFVWILDFLGFSLGSWIFLVSLRTAFLLDLGFSWFF